MEGGFVSCFVLRFRGKAFWLFRWPGDGKAYLRRQNMMAVEISRKGKKTTGYSSDVLDSPLDGVGGQHVRLKTARKGAVAWFTTAKACGCAGRRRIY